MDFEELTDRITFRQKKNKKNNYGESEEVKEAVGSCWAGVRRATIKEFSDTEGRANTITF
ncbi:head-tail adaptor protein, partial [Listeria monocytogenes]|nr:head-tail adaptor protein [Listeria monocytogenes]